VGDYLTVGDLIIVKGTRFSDAAMGYDITSRCARIIYLGDYYMDNEGKVMGIYKLNFFIFNQDIPTESRPVAPNPMLINITIHEMEIIADCSNDCIESTARAVHYKKYEPVTARGIFNNFPVHSRVSCGGGFAVTAIDAKLYIESSQVLLKSIPSFVAAPMRVYSKCLEVSKVTRQLLSRVGAKQMLCGKATVSMSPGVWLTIKRQMLAMPTLSSGEHPLHYSEVAVDVQGGGNARLIDIIF
jgi:hypothetical protein